MTRYESQSTDEVRGLAEEPPSHFLAAVDSNGQDTQVPVWVLESNVSLDGADSVSAWVEGVASDDAPFTNVDTIERDAHRLLAAVAWHRRVARSATTRQGRAGRKAAIAEVIAAARAWVSDRDAITLDDDALSRLGPAGRIVLAVRALDTVEAGIVDAEIADAPDQWVLADWVGGYVCSACQTPTESEPCPDHQPAKAAEAHQ